LGDTVAASSKALCSIVQFARSKRIEEAERLQYALWMLCNQMQRSIHSLDVIHMCLFSLVFMSSLLRSSVLFLCPSRGPFHRESLNAFEKEQVMKKRKTPSRGSGKNMMKINVLFFNTNTYISPFIYFSFTFVV